MADQDLHISALSEQDIHPVSAQLRDVANGYLKKHKGLSVNALAKRMDVSEPTLRRIVKGQLKTKPSLETLMKVLSYVGKTSALAHHIHAHPGPIARELKTCFPTAAHSDFEMINNAKLEEALRDTTSFVLYNLACSDNGLHQEQIVALFGEVGLSSAEQLRKDGLLSEIEGIYHASFKKWCSSPELSAKHIKSLANFIKPDRVKPESPLTPVFANLTGHIQAQAYKKILKIHQQAFRKTVQILRDPKNSGDLPVFFLGAFDTLSKWAAHEWKSPNTLSQQKPQKNQTSPSQNSEIPSLYCNPKASQTSTPDPR